MEDVEEGEEAGTCGESKGGGEKPAALMEGGWQDFESLQSGLVTSLEKESPSSHGTPFGGHIQPTVPCVCV